VVITLDDPLLHRADVAVPSYSDKAFIRAAIHRQLARRITATNYRSGFLLQTFACDASRRVRCIFGASLLQ